MTQTTGSRDLAEGFKQMFELSPALSADDIDQVFRIRHDVYCRDLGWEPVRQDGRESDEFDRHSLHCLLRRRGTHEPVGCTRLILTRPDKLEQPLPIEVSCRDTIDRSIVDPSALARRSIGEVSRLAVLSTYRQRRGESQTAVPPIEGDVVAPGTDSRFPFIPVSLYLGAAAMARRAGIEHVFVLTEPRLASHFVRIGFDIRVIGTAIEHRGERVPSVLSSSKVVAGLRPLIRPLYSLIEAAVDAAFDAHPDALTRVTEPQGSAS